MKKTSARWVGETTGAETADDNEGDRARKNVNWKSPKIVWRSTFNVQRSAFGVRRSACI
jgi:hypothetical protein